MYTIEGNPKSLRQSVCEVRFYAHFEKTRFTCLQRVKGETGDLLRWAGEKTTQESTTVLWTSSERGTGPEDKDICSYV